jgi:hypothetical protein
MNRVATILHELTEVIQAKGFIEALIPNIPVFAFDYLPCLNANEFFVYFKCFLLKNSRF